MEKSNISDVTAVGNSSVKADLHLHSRFSDGEFSPEKLVRLATRAGLDVISLTDHDTVNGLERAQQAARKYSTRLIPGVELEAFFKTNKSTYSLHILGYNIRDTDTNLRKTLEKIHRARQTRARQILDKLAGLNIELPMDAVLEFARGDLIGRVHIAQALKKLKFVETIEEAFDKYIGDDGPAYVPKDVHNPREIINLIHESGGIAVWAHPWYTGNDALLYPLMDMGLDGLECYHKEFSPLLVRHYLKLARKHDLIVSGGSDYHGSLEENFELGEWWFNPSSNSPLATSESNFVTSG